MFVCPYKPCSIHSGTRRNRERPSSSKEFIGNAAQSILVTSLTHITLKLFWCHIRTCTNQISTSCSLCRYCNTKISKHYFTVSIEQDIFGLHITMNNILLMSV